MRLKNRIAIVTGGGSGLGAGIAERFAEEGARLVLADLKFAKAKPKPSRSKQMLPITPLQAISLLAPSTSLAQSIFS